MRKKQILTGFAAAMVSLSLVACSQTNTDTAMQEKVDTQTQTEQPAGTDAEDSSAVEPFEGQEASDVTADMEPADGNETEQTGLLLSRYVGELNMCDLNGIALAYEENNTDGQILYHTKGINELDYIDDGCLYYELRDMDEDNVPELFTINIENYNEGYEINTVIYEAKDGQVVQAAKKTLVGGVLGENVDSATIRFLLKDGKYICADSWQHAFVSADGAWVNLYACYYNGAEFVETATFDFCGSDMYEIGKGETELVDQLNTMRYEKAAVAVYDRDILHFCAADEGVEALLKISLTNSMETEETQWNEKPVATVRQYNKNDMNQGYILPQSNTRLLTADELKGMSKENLRIARNEIYARYGWRFEDEDLQKHFAACAWYAPAENIDDAVLSDIERFNKDLLVEAENNWTDAPVPMRDYMGYIDGIEELDAKELGTLSGFLSGMDAYGFVQSMYDDVRDVNLSAVFYSGGGIGEEGLAEKTADEYLKISGQEEFFTDYIALKEADINQLLLDKTGYGLADMHYALGWCYLPDSEAYGREAGDTNYMAPQVVDGVKTPDGTYYVEYHNPNYDMYDEKSDCILTLKKTDDGYQFVSNRVMR